MASPVREDDASGLGRLIAKVRARAAAGDSLHTGIGGDSHPPVPAADGPARHLPLVVASVHGVSTRASLDELGRPDFGKALRRWLDLERDRMFGAPSSTSRVPAPQASVERERGIERGREPATARAAEPPP